MKIYADNAATTKPTKKVIETLMHYTEQVFGNPSSLYTTGQIAKDALEDARERIAKHIGCMPNELYFTSGGSESDNQAIMSAAQNGLKNGKNKIISSTFEHHAVLHVLENLGKQGFEIVLLPVYEDGIVRVEDLENAIDDKTALVTIMTANNEIGTIQPIKQLGEVCKRHNVVFHTDAVQAVGHLPINVKEQNIDMLSLSAHKFHGPKGIGALYVKKGISLQSLIAGGAQERRKRAGTENVPGIMAMAAALDEALENLDNKMAYVANLRDSLQKELSKIPYSKVNGNLDNRLPGILNICFEGVEGEAMLLYTDDAGISVSSGSACTSGDLDPSHVLLAIGLPHEIAHGSMRISLCDKNTMEEIEYIAQNVPKVIERLRIMSPIWKDLQEGKKEHVI